LRKGGWAEAGSAFFFEKKKQKTFVRQKVMG
jgi:hypothetical protein